MKFLIAVDLEGCACVNGEPYKSLSDAKDYAFACRQATREAAGAAVALFSLGAEEVIVWDNHGASLNLDYDVLPEKCLILSGVGKRSRYTFIDETYDGAILLGYHAMDGTLDGTLAHTFSSAAYQRVTVNGIPAGEIAIDAMLLGEKGVPVIMVTGDDKACAEAKAFLPNAVTVETKKSFGYNVSLSKHPKAAQGEIYQAAVRAATNAANMKALDYAAPVTLEFRFKRIEAAGEAERAGFERTDAYTCHKTFDKLSDYFRN